MEIKATSAIRVINKDGTANFYYPDDIVEIKTERYQYIGRIKLISGMCFTLDVSEMFLEKEEKIYIDEIAEIKTH